jgi:hypothetical protein
MNLDDFPAPEVGFVITHVLVVADQDRSRKFYRPLLGGQVPLECDPVIIKVANTWLTLVTGGGPHGRQARRQPRRASRARLYQRVPQRARWAGSAGDYPSAATAVTESHKAVEVAPRTWRQIAKSVRFKYWVNCAGGGTQIIPFWRR